MQVWPHCCSACLALMLSLSNLCRFCSNSKQSSEATSPFAYIAAHSPSSIYDLGRTYCSFTLSYHLPQVVIFHWKMCCFLAGEASNARTLASCLTWLSQPCQKVVVLSRNSCRVRATRVFFSTFFISGKEVSILLVDCIKFPAVYSEAPKVLFVSWRNG